MTGRGGGGEEEVWEREEERGIKMGMEGEGERE